MTRRASLLHWATVCLIVAIVALWTLFVNSCASVSVRIDPPLHFAETPLLAWYAAEQAANTEGGDVYWTADTGSMEPLLTGGDFIVVVAGDFTKRVVGEVMTYNAEWQPATEPCVTHRAVAKDSYGFVMSGDANPYSEAHWRVTLDNYVGLVTGIWRVKA